jgi:hypothetical protein
MKIHGVHRDNFTFVYMKTNSLLQLWETAAFIMEYDKASLYYIFCNLELQKSYPNYMCVRVCLWKGGENLLKTHV